MNKTRCHLHFGTCLLASPWVPSASMRASPVPAPCTLGGVSCTTSPTHRKQQESVRVAPKLFICPGSQTQNRWVFAHNVSWKVNVWAQSLSGGLPCLMWSSVKWSTPWHASFPQQGQSWHSVISEITCFLLPLCLCALQVEDKTQITSPNDGTRITLHTQTKTPATPRSISLTLSSHPPNFPSPSAVKKTTKNIYIY